MIPIQIINNKAPVSYKISFIFVYKKEACQFNNLVVYLACVNSWWLLLWQALAKELNGECIMFLCLYHQQAFEDACGHRPEENGQVAVVMTSVRDKFTTIRYTQFSSCFKFDWGVRTKARLIQQLLATSFFLEFSTVALSTMIVKSYLTNRPEHYSLLPLVLNGKKTGKGSSS